ncbi:ATP-binding protein [Streptomyces macrosporus]|uniref:ATP-binding protein n=1 Tax=Streptomyces macrosporus TaxID=44032 RepID=A0ABP5XGW7_9ACTN
MRSQNSATGRPTDVPHFTARLSGTRRGARLARRLAVQQFTEWTGLPYDCDAAHAVALVTNELATNAVTHGSVPGRDFRLTLFLPPEPGVVRIEVTDTRPERLPRHPAAEPMPPDALSGRGLLLVAVYARRWGCEVRDAFTKTVWAEVTRPS